MNGAEQNAYIERLGQERHPQLLGPMLFLCARHHHDPQVGAASILPACAQEGPPVHCWHVKVQKHDVGPMLLDAAERGRCAASAFDQVTLLPKDFLN